MKETQSILKQLFAAFPNTQVPKETVAMYLRLLQDIPMDDLQTVIDQSVAECKFVPTIAEIRERWRALTRVAPLAVEAWAMVRAEIWRVGRSQSPVFSNELVARAVKLFGWRELCLSEEPEIIRAQFTRMYNELAAREDSVNALLPASRRLVERRGLLPIGSVVNGMLVKGNNGN